MGRNCYNERMNEEKLLLLSCCGPCSCGVIKKLALQEHNFTVLFYNPNIDQEQEYQKRLEENKRVCEFFNIPFVSLDYEPQIWAEKVKGLEKEPERGKRCSVCFYMRLLRAAEYAKQHGFTHFSSVLGVSRYKDLLQVHKQGEKAAALTGIKYDDTNWRKGGLEELRREVNKEMGLYNQSYCGCIFSRRRETEQKK